MKPITRISTAGACLCLVLVAAACAPRMQTVYTGTYVRTWMGTTGMTHQVSGPVRLILDDGGHYVIEGESRDLPPSRSGVFQWQGSEFVLKDTGPATAGYDLSLIVDGEFEAAEEGAHLVLRQENPWGDSHLLLLERAGAR